MVSSISVSSVILYYDDLYFTKDFIFFVSYQKLSKKLKRYELSNQGTIDAKLCMKQMNWSDGVSCQL